MIFLLLLYLPHSFSPLHEHVDVIELSHVRSEEGDFDQVILWVWSPDYARYDVIKWVLVGQVTHCKLTRPYRGVCKFSWTGEYGKRHHVQAKLFRETWGADPERENKKVFPPKYRARLAQCRDK